MVDNWISVKKGVPQKDQHGESDEVLVNVSKFGRSDTNSHYAMLWYDHYHKKWRDDDMKDYEDNPDYMYVTHWMYLPDSPKFLKDVLKEL